MRRPKREKLSGIYVLCALLGKKIGYKYVGRTENIESRQREHLRLLRLNKHHSTKLQRYFNKYGENSLRFHLIQKCGLNELDFYEKFFIKCFDSFKNGFNHTEGGNGFIGTNGKPCVLTNIDTGETVKTKTITEFSEKFNLVHSGICVVLQGKAFYTGRWYSKENAWRPKIYELISPDGVIHKLINIDTRKFCEEHSLNKDSIYAFLTGKIPSYCGWRLATNASYIPRKIYAKYHLVSPTGEEFQGENVTELAKKFDVKPSGLIAVASGRLISYKGWVRPGHVSFHQTCDFSVISPTGQIHKVENKRYFCEQFGLESHNFGQMTIGKRREYKGWKLAA